MVDSGSTMIYELKVGMTCGGCSGAVERIFGKCDKITKVTCDVETKQVLVEGADGLDLEEMLAKWSKSADKSVEFVSKTAKEE
jgi:copper chaperone